MSNLFDMACPSCGKTDCIDIAATVWLRVMPDGTDPGEAENGDHEFTPDSPALCGACGHAATVAAFE